MVDMAHIAGLVAAGVHQSPVPYADVVTTTTHKTLRGPRGGMILCKEAVRQGHRQGHLPRHPGRPAGCTSSPPRRSAWERLCSPTSRTISKQIVNNAQALAQGLLGPGREAGFRRHGQPPDADGPDRQRALPARSWRRRLDEVHITANKNTIPGETRSPFITSGVRLGTPAVTTRGLKEADMDEIAACIAMCMEDNFEEQIDAIRGKVEAICQKYPLYQ